MAGDFRPESGPNAGSVVLAELARLWGQAAQHKAARGEVLSQTALAEQAGVARPTVNSWARGRRLPRDLDQLAAVGAVLAGWAGERAPSQREWSRLLRADQAATGASEPPSDPGRGKVSQPRLLRLP